MTTTDRRLDILGAAALGALAALGLYWLPDICTFLVTFGGVP